MTLQRKDQAWQGSEVREKQGRSLPEKDFSVLSDVSIAMSDNTEIRQTFAALVIEKAREHGLLESMSSDFSVSLGEVEGEKKFSTRESGGRKASLGFPRDAEEPVEHVHISLDAEAFREASKKERRLIVLHEAVHFKHFHHGERFWQILREIINEEFDQEREAENLLRKQLETAALRSIGLEESGDEREAPNPAAFFEGQVRALDIGA